MLQRAVVFITILVFICVMMKRIVFFDCNSFKEVLILFYFIIKSLMYFSIFSWEWDFYDGAENDWGGLISFYLLHFITLQLKYLNDSAYLSTVTCSSCHGVAQKESPAGVLPGGCQCVHAAARGRMCAAIARR